MSCGAVLDSSSSISINSIGSISHHLLSILLLIDAVSSIAVAIPSNLELTLGPIREPYAINAVIVAVTGSLDDFNYSMNHQIVYDRAQYAAADGHELGYLLHS